MITCGLAEVDAGCYIVGVHFPDRLYNSERFAIIFLRQCVNFNFSIYRNVFEHSHVTFSIRWFEDVPTLPNVAVRPVL